MNILDFRAGLDLLFDQNRISEVEPYLEGALRTAIGDNDDNAVVHVLNEMIGFYRETCDYDRAVMYGEKALEIIANAGEKDSEAYATTQLNLANALRAAGRLDEALEYYRSTEEIYGQIFKPDAFDYASLYNNMSLVYQEARMYPEAISCLRAAMDIVSGYPDKRFELAVTHTNLGNSMIGALTTVVNTPDDATYTSTDKDDIYAEIYEHLTEAVHIFHERNENGAHLGAALNGLGDLYYMQGDDKRALEWYAQALEAVDRNLGHIDYYYRVKGNYDKAYTRLIRGAKNGTDVSLPDVALSGMELCRLYYYEIIRPILERDFPMLTEHICAGLFGEGSDAYGYDDFASKDHDWGPGAVLLIDDAELFKKYGQDLNNALMELVDSLGSFRGYMPDTSSIRRGRRGAFLLSDYYKMLIGEHLAEYLLEETTESNVEDYGRLNELYMSVPEYALAAAVNGEIWDDSAGQATAVRDKLREYYPATLTRSMLMQNVTLFSQNAQYNYLRMKRRGDNASADILLAEGIMSAARITYILEKRYAPHDKWLLRGLREMSDETRDVADAIDRVMALAKDTPDTEANDASMRPVMDAIDEISLLLQKRMKELGIINEPKRYMEDIIMELKTDAASKDELVKRVVKDEWEAFDKVINEGGRADCQDNWGTFNIMRSSQYLTWDNDMLERYAEDFEASVQSGWNPIMEKYARMEESTAPDKYNELKDSLPPISDEKRAIIDEIVSVQVKWMEQFASEYPKLAGNARAIHTSEDTPYDTSYETYLRGELMTYGDEMLGMYGAFIVRLAKDDKNLAYMTMENTAKLYGYGSLDDAERAL